MHTLTYASQVAEACIHIHQMNKAGQAHTRTRFTGHRNMTKSGGVQWGIDL